MVLGIIWSKRIDLGFDELIGDLDQIWWDRVLPGWYSQMGGCITKIVAALLSMTVQLDREKGGHGRKPLTQGSHGTP